MKLIFSRINRWKVLIFLNAVYLVAGVAWICLIPYNNAPDENTHFHYSVEFIIQHHRLPVWGVDDIERFQHALSSYNQMPALNYVLCAVGAAIGKKAFGLEGYLGARLVSLLWGLVFLNFLFLAVKEICGNEKHALIVSAAIAFIPQVFFSFCYVNSDAHSLAIAAIAGYALVRFMRGQLTSECRGRACACPSVSERVPTSRATTSSKFPDLNTIFLAAAIGLLFSAKYNYYIYFPCIAVVLLLAAWRRVVSWQAIGKLIVASVVFSVIISGFWFIRNYFLYGNPLPILKGEQFFKAMALAREAHPVNHGLSIASLKWLFDQGFIKSTFDSFFAVFGYLNVGFHRSVYTILEFAVLAACTFFVIDLLRARDRLLDLIFAGLAVMVGLVMAMHVWACLTFDYQAQGRYNFTILLPIALFAGWAITRKVSLRRHVVFFLILMSWLFIGANLLIARTYASSIRFAVSWPGSAESGHVEKKSVLTARRTEKNFYSTGKMSFDGAAPASLRIDFPAAFLARYRDFKVEFETGSGVTNFDWTAIPPQASTNLIFNQPLSALDIYAQDAYLVLPLEGLPAKIKSARIEFRLEHRRLYDTCR